MASNTSQHPTPKTVHTYHCICTTFILAIPFPLESLPKRAEPAQDSALILPFEGKVEDVQAIRNLHPDQKAIIVRRNDGFEKRVLQRCSRCQLVIGYKLDEAHFDGSNAKADGLFYILPGSLTNTADMKNGKMPATPAWAEVA